MNIREYWIEEIQNVKEFQALASTEDGEIESINQAISDLMSDQFIETATEKGIARREKILSIIPFADDSLADRRFRVLSRWNSKLPYTYLGLVEKLNQLCGEKGYTIELNHNDYTLQIKVELTAKRMEQEVRDMTRKMIPANLALTVELRYRQHKELKRYTHAQLRAFRHRELREEDLKL